MVHLYASHFEYDWQIYKITNRIMGIGCSICLECCHNMRNDTQTGIHGLPYNCTTTNIGSHRLLYSFQLTSNAFVSH